ncbi:MAG: EamA family transporter, partial [Alistipes sp.]|nr:EamA family transporter [Alistipes sp.]
MWVSLAFLSALLLGLYDVAKKRSLRENAVLPVLWLNTLFSTIIFLPALIDSAAGTEWLNGTLFASAQGSWHDHAMVMIKAVMVLSSWIFGYFGIKNLPLTIVGPINATRPVLTLIGAMIIFGERLNGYQWVGVVLAIVSLYLLSRSSKKEGVDFAHNRWIYCVAAAAIIGVGCGLYDRYIMYSLNAVFVQSWYTFYQFLLMSVIVAVLWLPKRKEQPFHWSWAIPMISILLTAGDMAYLHSLTDASAMIAVVAMIRRSSVVVS